jgi:hypothetical protein
MCPPPNGTTKKTFVSFRVFVIEKEVSRIGITFGAILFHFMSGSAPAAVFSSAYSHSKTVAGAIPLTTGQLSFFRDRKIRRK